MKYSLFLILIMLSVFPVLSQDARTMLQFESAEKAFNSGNYEESLQYLNDVEKQTGVTSKTLYLRIVTENELLGDGANLYANENGFSSIEKLRTLTTKYLKALANQEIDEKYRKVYEISEHLDRFPKNQSEWLEVRKVHLAAQKQQEQERERLKEQELKKAELNQLNNGSLSLDEVKLHKISKISNESNEQTATVYFLRLKNGSKKNPSVLFLNDVESDKMEKGEYAVFHFTPGLLKIGMKEATNRTKLSKGATIGLVAVTPASLLFTTGQIITKSYQPLFLTLGIWEKYYINVVVLSNKTVVYSMLNDNLGEQYITTLKKIN